MKQGSKGDTLTFLTRTQFPALTHLKAKKYMKPHVLRTYGFFKMNLMELRNDEVRGLQITDTVSLSGSQGVALCVSDSWGVARCASDSRVIGAWPGAWHCVSDSWGVAWCMSDGGLAQGVARCVSDSRGVARCVRCISCAPSLMTLRQV